MLVPRGSVHALIIKNAESVEDRVPLTLASHPGFAIVPSHFDAPNNTVHLSVGPANIPSMELLVNGVAGNILEGDNGRILTVVTNSMSVNAVVLKPRSQRVNYQDKFDASAVHQQDCYFEVNRDDGTISPSAKPKMALGLPDRGIILPFLPFYSSSIPRPIKGHCKISSVDVTLCCVPKGSADQIVLKNITNFTRHKTLLKTTEALGKPCPLLCASHPGLALTEGLEGMTTADAAEEFYMVEDENKFVFVSESTPKKSNETETLKNLKHFVILDNGTVTTDISRGALSVRFRPTFRPRSAFANSHALQFSIPISDKSYTPMTLVQVPGMAMTVKYVHVHESQSRPCSSDGGGGWHARPNDGQESFVLTIGPEGEAVDVTSMQCSCFNDENPEKPREVVHVTEFGVKVYAEQPAPPIPWQHVKICSHDKSMSGCLLQKGPMPGGGHGWQNNNGWGLGEVIALPPRFMDKTRQLRMTSNGELEVMDKGGMLKVLGVTDMSHF